jgi:hypothetical protein
MSETMELPRPQRAQVGSSTRNYDLSGYEVDQNSAYAVRSRRASFAGSEYTVDQEKDGGCVKRFFKTRRRMCLCVCCLVMLILIAIMIPITLFVIVPAVAQSFIKAATMTVTSANITEPQEDYFAMQMTGMITDTGPLDAEIEIKDKIRLYYGDAELGRMAMEPMVAKAGVGATLDVSSIFELTDKEAFGDFAKVMLRAEEFTWTMKGEARVRALGITLDGIKLEKDITLKGMNNFPGINIKSMDMPSNHPLGGIAMVASASMGNPSPFGIVIGDLTFDIYYEDIRMATANATQVTIVPGTNDLTMNGRALPQANNNDLERLSVMLSNFVTGKPSNLRVVGVEVRPNATAKPISWLQRGFAGTTMEVTVDGLKDVELIQSLELGTLGLTFTPQTTWSPVANAPNVVARFKMPFGFPIEMKEISQDVEIHTNGGLMATLAMPPTPANGTSATGMMTTALKNVPMVVPNEGRENFKKFVSEVALGSGSSMTMKGVAATVASTAIGNVKISGVEFEKVIQMKGMNGLRNAPTAITEVLVVGGTPEYIIIHATITTENPVPLELSAGKALFDATFNGEKVGDCIIPDMSLKVGSNTIKAVIHFHPETAAAVAAGRKMLSDFVAGIRNQVTVIGRPDTSEIESINGALGGLKLSALLPALNENMLRGARFTISPQELLSLQAPSQVDAYNPMDAAIDLISLSAHMTYKGQSLGDLNHDFGSTPLRLKPKTVTTTPIIMMKIPLNMAGIRAALAALGGKMVVDIDAVMVISVGGYRTTMDYSVTNLKVDLVSRLE